MADERAFGLRLNIAIESLGDLPVISFGRSMFGALTSLRLSNLKVHRP